MSVDAIKARTARAAVDALVESGQRIGLGTGSTAIHAIRRVADLVAAGELSDLRIVPTSSHTMTECWRLGLSLYTLNDPAVAGRLDVVIDGADEVDPRLNLIKGGGAALLMEKVVASAAERFAVVVDHGKLVEHLFASHPVPVEVIPAALTPVRARLEELGHRPILREAVRKAGPVLTDNGNFVLDVTVPAGTDPAGVERAFNAIPGLVGNGVFVGLTTDLFVGYGTDRIDHQQAPDTGAAQETYHASTG